MNQKLNQLLQDCQDFFSFIGSLYGICGALTSLFPLSGKVAQFMPPPPHHPKLFSLTATLLCLFVTLSSFVHRDRRNISIAENSWNNFLRGLACMLVYTLVSPFVLREFNIQDGVLKLFLEVIKILTYWGTFGFFTGAFVTLAIAEYIRKSNLK